MKLKTTIILLIVAIIGISYVLLYEKKQLPHEEWERLQKKVFPYFKSSLVNKIELRNASGKIVMEKDNNDFWYIVEPQRLRANNSEVNSIISEFEFMHKVGSFKKEGDKAFDLKDYGLEEQDTSITMYTNVTMGPEEIRVDGPKDKYTVYVGKKLAAGDNVYIKSEINEEVVVVPGRLSDLINKNILDLRSKWVFSFDKEAVDGLEIKSDKYRIVCRKKGNFWRLVEPIEDIADLQVIKDIIAKLKNLQINREDFLPEEVEDDLKRFGLDTPRYVLTVSAKGVNQTVIIGHSLDDKIYVKRQDEPTIFLIKDTLLIDLNRKPNDLRDRALVRFDSYGTYGLNKIEIKTPSQQITIKKALDLDWKIVEPVKIYADQDTVRNFIETIKTLEIEDFVADEPTDLSHYGLENPLFEISVTKEEDKELAKFFVGNKLSDGKKCYVMRQGEDPVYTVPTIEFYDKIDKALLTFRDRLICEFDKEQVKKIVIEKPDRTFLCEKTNKKDLKGRIQWELSKPVNTFADPDKVDQIVWDLSFLKAERHVVEGPKDLKTYGLDNPSIKVHVTYEKKTEQPEKETTQGVQEQKESIKKIIETRTLLVGKKVSDEEKVNSYCMFSDSDLVSELPWPKVRNFDAELVPTKILNFDRINVVEVTLDYPEKNIIIEKINNVWKLTKPDRDDVQGREVDYFVRSLEKLKGEYIEQYKATNLTQFSLDNPLLTINVKTESKNAVLLIGKKKADEGFYVKNRDSDYIYVVSKENAGHLMKTVEDFTTVDEEPISPIKAPLESEMPLDVNVQEKTPHGSPHGGFH